MMYLLFFLILGLDQATKFWVETAFVPHRAYPVTPFFNVFLTYNQGVSFSLLWGGKDRQYLLIALSCIICLFLGKWFLTEKNKWTRVGLICVLAGALGNVLDRLRFHKVVDFLDFYLYSYHWPAFNVADIAICVGAGLIVLGTFLESRRKHV